MAYTHLLVPSDGSDASARAIVAAADLARREGARMTILHVQPSNPLPVSGLGDSLDVRTLQTLLAANISESDRILAEGSRLAGEAGVAAQCERVPGDLPHRAILEAAERLGCDLIVMASHGRRGLQALLIGSETQRVLTHAHCPVLVHR